MHIVRKDFEWHNRTHRQTNRAMENGCPQIEPFTIIIHSTHRLQAWCVSAKWDVWCYARLLLTTTRDAMGHGEWHAHIHIYTYILQVCEAIFVHEKPKMLLIIHKFREFPIQFIGNLELTIYMHYDNVSNNNNNNKTKIQNNSLARWF